MMGHGNVKARPGSRKPAVFGPRGHGVLPVLLIFELDTSIFTP